jgi:DNA polymerase-3 subunit delta
MTIDALLARLREGRIPPVVVLFGNESWFADRALDAFVTSFLDGDRGGLLTLDAPRAAGDTEGTPLGAALDEARTAPMFAGRKVVFFRSRGALAAEEIEGLERVARAGPPFSRVLVFVPELSKGAEKKLGEAGALTAAARRPFEKAWPGEPEWKTPLNRWVLARAGERGKRISLQDAHVLTRILGAELGTLAAVLDRLVIAVGDRPVITREDLRAVVGREREYDAFAFGEAIYRLDAAEALRVARNSFLDGVSDRWGKKSRDEDVVAGRLLWSARRRLGAIQAATALISSGKSREEVVQALGGRRNPGAVRAAEEARKFQPDELLRHQLLLTDAEAELRSAVPRQAVISRLVLALTGALHG